MRSSAVGTAEIQLTDNDELLTRMNVKSLDVTPVVPFLVVLSHVCELISAISFLKYKNGLPAENAVAVPVIGFDRLRIPKTSLHFRAEDRIAFLHKIGFRQAVAQVLERKLRHRGDRFLVFARHCRFKLRPERRSRLILNSAPFDRDE